MILPRYAFCLRKKKKKVTLYALTRTHTHIYTNLFPVLRNRWRKNGLDPSFTYDDAASLIKIATSQMKKSNPRVLQADDGFRMYKYFLTLHIYVNNTGLN